MKKTLLFSTAVLLLLSLCGCGEKIDGKYLANETDYIVLGGTQVKMYEDSELNQEGSFTLKDNVVTFTFGDESKEYLLEDNMLCLNNPIENGFIPSGERFSSVCIGADGEYEVSFYDDGTVTKSMSLFGINEASFDGLYKRNGSLITVNWLDGGTGYFLVYNEKLYEKVYILET